MSSVCVPRPMISPSSRTRIWSASAMVDHALGHDQHRRPRWCGCERGPEPGVGAEVERRERVVEHVDLRLDARRARAIGESLSLTARTFVPPWAIYTVDALGIACTNRRPGRSRAPPTAPRRSRRACRSGGCSPRCRRTGTASAGRSPTLAPQQIGVEFADVDAVDQHRATTWRRRAGHEVHEGRLARPGSSR